MVLDVTSLEKLKKKIYNNKLFIFFIEINGFFLVGPYY